jgi:hypothetical protein
VQIDGHIFGRNRLLIPVEMGFTPSAANPPKQRRSDSHRPTPALTCLSFFGKASWPRFQMQKPPSCANTCE